MSNFWDVLDKKRDEIHLNKQNNIKSIENVDFTVDNYIDNLTYSLEVVADTLKENPAEISNDVNKPQEVEPGVPKDPTAKDEETNESEETDDATMDAGDSTDTGEGPGEENATQEEEKPEVQLNKNEFATEFGMKYLSRLFVQLIDSIDSSYRKLSTIKTIDSKLVAELLNLKNIIEEENGNIIVTNIWETQTKYYLYVDKYKEILKRLGVGIVSKKQ